MTVSEFIFLFSLWKSSLKGLPMVKEAVISKAQIYVHYLIAHNFHYVRVT